MARDPFDDLAAELVGGAQEEFVADLTLRLARMLRRGVENPDLLGQLGRLSREEALAVWAEWEGRVTGGCRAAFEEAMAEEDERIVGALRALSPSVAYDTAYGSMVAAEAARGVGEILRRQNVALCDAMADSWYRITADAVTRVESGEGLRAAMERACAALADAGLETVDYRSGVRTSADAAMRRHLVTQWNQARADLLWHRMDEWECDLVFTSAHYGARPTHAVWQGKVFSRSGSSPDYPDLVQATGYGTVTGLCGANCVIEGTLVSGPLATAAYRREYAGEVVRIRTALGHDLTVTPNHPVLTGRGWVPANEVEQGDHVFSRVFRDGMPLGVRPDKQEREPTVEHEFHALGDSSGVGTLLGSPADFHGDGVLDQQVNVVLVDGGLMSDLQSTTPKHAPKPLLLDAARLSDPGFSGGPVDEVVVCASHAANGVVGAPAQLSPLLGAHAGHPRAHGLAWGLGHDTDAFEPVRDGRLGDAESLGDGGLVHPAIPEVEHATGVNGLSPAVDLKPKLSELIGDEGLSAGEMSPHLPDGRTFLVETDEVVDIDRGTWSGHVYNLSTLGGWYFANGIVTHNCRHEMTPYVEGYSKLPDTDFSEQERLTGMTSEEYYEATQKQRRYEAAIRKTKREIAVGREAGLDMVDKRVLLGRQQARVRQWCKDKGLPRDYERERAYGVGTQPRALGRTPALSSSARRAETAPKKAAARAGELSSDEAKAIAKNDMLVKQLGSKAAGDLAAAIDDAIAAGGTRKRAAQAIARGIQGGTIKIETKKHISRNQFDANRGEVFLRAEYAPPRMVAHECTHALDFLTEVSYGPYSIVSPRNRWTSIEYTEGSGYIATLMKDDWADLVAKHDDPVQFVKDRASALGLGKSYSDAGFLDDMLEAASGTQMPLGIGSHMIQNPRYWSQLRGQMPSIEALADYAGSAIGNEVEWGLMRELFPQATHAMDALLEAILNATS